MRTFTALQLVLTLLPWCAEAINLPEGTSKLQAANEIDKAYVVPLRLKGRSAEAAIDILLAQGFQCGIDARSPTGLDDRPLSQCFKKPSGYGNLCEELIVTLRFEAVPALKSRAQVLERLPELKVASALPFCPYDRVAPAVPHSDRKTAEGELADRLRSLALLGNARVAFENLLVAGFSCGISIEPTAPSTTPRESLLCTKWSLQDSPCVLAVVRAEVGSPQEAAGTAVSVNRLRSMSVTALHSECAAGPTQPGHLVDRSANAI